MTEAKANTPHPQYSALEVKREVYRAVYGGTDSIRATGKANLPMYPAEASSEYDIRLNSSTIDGLVTGGVDQLCGSVFESEVDTSEVHASLTDYLENIDNKGNSFNIFARDAFRESFEGFSLILVDMPNAVASDAEQEKALGLRPYLNLYTAANVINWRYAVNETSKQKELVLLVLKEVSSEPDGDFGVADVTRYRVFRMMNGVVTWELWQKGDKKAVVQIANGTIQKVKAIPVAFIGDVCADPKLLVESRLEIKAYQKESSFDVIEYLSVPTFYTKGYEGEDKLTLGASSHIKLPLEGEVGYAQIDAAGHASLKDTISEIKNHIKARVNYLISEAAAEKTATQANIEDRDKQSRLIVWADELKDALETALMYMGQFIGLGSDGAGSIVLTTSWDKAKVILTPEAITAEANLVTDGLASLESFVAKREAAGLLPTDVTAEQELERIKADDERAKSVMPVRNAGILPNDKTQTNNETIPA